MFKRGIFILFISIVMVSILTALVAADDYKLNVDDQLYISVWGHPDLQQDTLIEPDGTISFPLIEKIKAVELTKEELNDVMTEKLSEYIKEPKLNILIKKYKHLNVMVMGEVKAAGSYQMRDGDKVLKLISRAGGLNEIADSSNIKLIRDNKKINVNLADLFTQEKPINDNNYQLADGDVLYVPGSMIEVTILGEVSKPGHYQLEKGLRISNLLARAGSLTEKAAKEATYISDNKVRKVDLNRLFNGDMKENQLLVNGDSIYIPETSYQVTILGEVNKPGTYSWNDTLHLANLLAAAGSQTKRGDIANIKISHKDGSYNHVNLKKYFTENSISSNPALSPGDIVLVEELKRGSQVTILGEVNKPGAYDWNKNLYLADILAAAGNQTDRGDIENIQITHRDGSSAIINLKDYFMKNKEEANPALSPGDVVLIQEIKTSSRVAILGEVNKPGAYDWDENMKLADLMALAGNNTERGNITRIKILHNNGEYNDVNLQQYFTGNKGANPALNPGDVVIIGEKSTIDWKEVFTYITGLNALKTFLDISW